MYDVLPELLRAPDKIAITTAIVSAVMTVALRVVSGHVFRAGLRAGRELAARNAELSRRQEEWADAERRRGVNHAQRAAAMDQRPRDAGDDWGAPTVGVPGSSMRAQSTSHGSHESSTFSLIRTTGDARPAPAPAMHNASRVRPEVALWLARLVEDVANVDVLPMSPQPPAREQDRQRYAHAG